jgi:hypothetical protein
MSLYNKAQPLDTMSESRSSNKNFIRTGQFTKRLDGAGRLSDIPEDKAIDGRPLSYIRTSEKHTSEFSTASDSAKPSVQVSTTAIDPVGERAPTTHLPEHDLLFVPPDIKTPTTFGPNNAYTAVPSIITYSASGRQGLSRVTLREATPEEAAERLTSDAHANSAPPQYVHTPPPPRAYSNIPVLQPPPDFQPIRTENNSSAESEKSQQSQQSQQSSQAVFTARNSRLSQASQSIRTSTATSFRTSTASVIEDGGVTRVDNNSSHTSTTPKQHESWPLPLGGLHESHVHAAQSVSQDHSVQSTPRSFPGTFGETSQSRFSWHVSNADRARSWFTRWFVEWWLMEIFSWVFSLICMLIIAIVLLKFDGKQMPDWKLGVSINAFISIFTGFAKSALLLPTAEALGQLKWDWFKKKEKNMMDFEVLDSASRGPWGSMVLLARTKGV